MSKTKNQSKEEPKYYQPAYHPAPELLELLGTYPNLLEVSGKPKSRPRWKDTETGDIYEWDKMHGRLERYSKKGIHLGEYDPETGEQTKPPEPGRKIEI